MMKQVDNTLLLTRLKGLKALDIRLKEVMARKKGNNNDLIIYIADSLKEQCDEMIDEVEHYNVGNIDDEIFSVVLGFRLFALDALMDTHRSNSQKNKKIINITIIILITLAMIGLFATV